MDLVTYNPVQLCELNINGIVYIPFLGAVLADLIVNIFVTTKLNVILIKANLNQKEFIGSTIEISGSSGISSSLNMSKKKNVFTSVLLWNVLQSIVAWFMNTAIASRIIFENKRIDSELKLSINFLNAVFCILTSYILTMDAKIVKTIRKIISNQREEEFVIGAAI